MTEGQTSLVTGCKYGLRVLHIFLQSVGGNKPPNI